MRNVKVNDESIRVSEYDVSGDKCALEDNDDERGDDVGSETKCSDAEEDVSIPGEAVSAEIIVAHSDGPLTINACVPTSPNYHENEWEHCVWNDECCLLSEKCHVRSESRKENQLRFNDDLKLVREVSCAVDVSERVVDSGVSKEHGNLGPTKHQIPGVKFSKIHVPANLREAQASPQWEQWHQAMREEQDSLDAHEVMEFTQRPRGHKVIPVHWIFSVKVDEFGNVIRFKARLVAQGCRQVPGVDVDEVFAPTSSFGARRALLAVAALPRKIPEPALRLPLWRKR
jgi:hypothetical protein